VVAEILPVAGCRRARPACGHLVNFVIAVRLSVLVNTSSSARQIVPMADLDGTLGRPVESSRIDVACGSAALTNNRRIEPVR
jgi:hypothetical protein